MPKILKQSNLVLKAVAVSGEPDGEALKKLSGSIFGLKFSTEMDTLAIKFGVNVSTRRRGLPTEPVIQIDILHKLDKAVLTRRLVLGIVNRQFDMMGIAAPLLIRGKVAMRDLFVKELGLGWDNILPSDQRETWITYLRELVEARQLVFERCVRPEGNVKQFWIVVFFDGSDDAYATVIYCRWLMAASRVIVVQALEYKELPSKVLVGGDSETVLAAREKSCGALGEYFGNRIGECWDLQGKISELVPVGIDGEGEWYHMPSKYNAADKPTRLNSKASDLGISSEWQNGPSYLQQPFEEWPWERNFAAKKMTDVVPKIELTAKYRGIQVDAMSTTESKTYIRLRI